MTGFTDLPNELIVEVWRQVVDPKSVENFALSSKRIYALGGDFIEEHNELKAKFSSLPQYDSEPDSGPAETLKILLQRPRIALYVRTISVSEWGSPYDPEEDLDDAPRRDRPYFEDIKELLRQEVENTPFILEDEILDWLNALESEDEPAIIALVLTMLPNVHSLTLPRSRSAEKFLFGVVKRIVERQDTEALSQLSKVKLLSGDSITFEEFDWVRTFATLPSVKAIEARNIHRDCDCSSHNFPDVFDHVTDCVSECYGPDENIDCGHLLCHERQLVPLPRTSTVTHLTFTNCIINTKRLFGFLKGIQALESFEYYSTHVFSDPDEIVDALVAHAKRSLRKLKLRSDFHKLARMPDIDTSYCAVTLNDLEAVKELETEYDLLLGWESKGELADVLPSSIETVHLDRLNRNNRAWYEVQDAVLDLAAQKAERLPNLTEFTIELYETEEGLNTAMVSTMKQRCEEVGVQLNVNIFVPME